MSLRVWTAILAGLQVVSAGTVLTEVVEPRWAALFSLLVAGAQAATARYVGGTPAGEVRTRTGRPPL